MVCKKLKVLNFFFLFFLHFSTFYFLILKEQSNGTQRIQSIPINLTRQQLISLINSGQIRLATSSRTTSNQQPDRVLSGVTNRSSTPLVHSNSDNLNNFGFDDLTFLSTQTQPANQDNCQLQRNESQNNISTTTSTQTQPTNQSTPDSEPINENSAQPTDNIEDDLNNSRNIELEQHSFVYSQSDENQPLSIPRRKRKRVQTSKHDQIKNLYRNHDDQDNDDNINNDAESDLLIKRLKDIGAVNKEKINKLIPKYKEIEGQRKEIRKRVKSGELLKEDLNEDELNLLKRRKKNAKFLNDLDNRIYINVRSSLIKDFFDDTVKEIIRLDKTTDETAPISYSSLNLLCRKSFIYLYYQGIKTYKDASAQVGTLFTALVSNYDDIYEDSYGGGFRYKAFFLKQMQNIRASLLQAGLLNEDDFTDVANLDQNLPAS